MVPTYPRAAPTGGVRFIWSAPPPCSAYRRCSIRRLYTLYKLYACLVYTSLIFTKYFYLKYEICYKSIKILCFCTDDDLYGHYTDYTHVWCTRTQCCIRRLENPRKIFTAVKTVDVCCRVVSGLRSTKVKDKFAYHHSWHTSIRAKQALNSGRLRFGPV